MPKQTFTQDELKMLLNTILQQRVPYTIMELLAGVKVTDEVKTLIDKIEKSIELDNTEATPKVDA